LSFRKIKKELGLGKETQRKILNAGIADLKIRQKSCCQGLRFDSTHERTRLFSISALAPFLVLDMQAKSTRIPKFLKNERTLQATTDFLNFLRLFTVPRSPAYRVIKNFDQIAYIVIHIFPSSSAPVKKVY
jgi:hypothetical protein